MAATRPEPKRPGLPSGRRSTEKRTMANPKRRWSHARKGAHRAHHHLKAAGLSVCPRCSSSKRPHEICANCGYYKGTQLLQPKPES